MAPIIISVFANTANVLLDKFILAKQRMKVRDYIPLLFAFLFLITFASLLIPGLGAINLILASNQQFIFYFILMILLAIIWNIFYYQGLQEERLVEFELILMLTPLVTVLMVTLFFPEEFKAPVFGAALVGSLTLFLSHLRKHHFEFDKYAIQLVLAVVLIAMETMVQKELLNIYSPALLYAARTGLLALFFAIYYRPNAHHFHRPEFRLVFWSAFLGSVGMVTKFYGFQTLGVTYTTLLLLLVPVLVAWSDARVNKTPVSHRTLLAFVIILGCVIYATLNQ